MERDGQAREVIDIAEHGRGVEGGKDTVFSVLEQHEFGVRVYPTGAKRYIMRTRACGSGRRLAIGQHGVITPEEARRRAALIIARIKAGEDPVPERLAAKRLGRTDRRRVRRAVSREMRGGALEAQPREGRTDEGPRSTSCRRLGSR